MYTEQSLH